MPALADLALNLYRQVAEAERQRAEAVREAAARVAENDLKNQRTIASLAIQRFEFDRLLGRIVAELTQLGAHDSLRAIDLFSRSWKQELERKCIEVRDLAGLPLTKELAAVVDVNGAIPECGLSHVVIRETLAPLVMHRGQVISAAVVNTSVPELAAEQSAPQPLERIAEEFDASEKSQMETEE
jgi:hypothetical protein